MIEEQASEIIQLLKEIEENTATTAKVLSHAKEFPNSAAIGVKSIN